MGRASTTALITGASAGLGEQYARLFAADGHQLVLVARRRERLEALARELGAECTVIDADLASPGAVPDLVDALTREGITVDYLVNNAGLGSCGRYWDLDPGREHEQILVNVAALAGLTRALLPGMVERGFGRVLNVASTAAFQPGPRMATYYASKAFVLHYSEALAYELRGMGVSVTAHCPGAVATEFADLAGNDKTHMFAVGVADAESTARHGYRSMHAGVVVAVPGVVNKIMTATVGSLPRALVRHVTAWVNAQASGSRGTPGS